MRKTDKIQGKIYGKANGNKIRVKKSKVVKAHRKARERGLTFRQNGQRPH